MLGDIEKIKKFLSLKKVKKKMFFEAEIRIFNEILSLHTRNYILIKRVYYRQNPLSLRLRV